METLNLYQRMSLIMRDVTFIGHEDKRVNGQYSYVGHNAVSGAIREAMVRHGVFSYPHSIETEESGNRLCVRLLMRFINVDNPEEFIDTASLGYGIDASDKIGGKAFSYAIKYALLKTFLIPTGDNTDDIERDNISHILPEKGEEPAPKKARNWS